tara:strand:- start:1702 stop:2286 length:585 start_codon:yes stop_codon:yes gene_type:complete
MFQDKEIIDSLVDLSDRLDLAGRPVVADNIDGLMKKIADFTIEGWYYYPQALQPEIYDDDRSIDSDVAEFGMGYYFLGFDSSIVFYVPIDASRLFPRWQRAFHDLVQRRVQAGQYYIENLTPILQEIDSSNSDPTTEQATRYLEGIQHITTEILDDEWGVPTLHSLVNDGLRMGIRGSFIEAYTDIVNNLVSQL